MKAPDTFMLDGHAYSWRRILELRRQQLAAWHAAEPRQLALFAMKSDRRAVTDRTAAGRYREPSLFAESGRKD